MLSWAWPPPAAPIAPEAIWLPAVVLYAPVLPPGSVGPVGGGRADPVSARVGAYRSVAVSGKLLEAERNRFAAARLSQRPRGQAGSRTLMDGNAAREVGQRKGGLPVTSVGGPDQREQGIVLGDGQKLPLTQRPPEGSEIAGKGPDLAQKWISHDNLRMPRPEGWRLTEE